MKRKIIQLAGKTHVVSLPASFVRKYGLKKGDEVEVEERGKELVLVTEKKTDIRKIVVDLEKIGPLHENYISFLYQEGYDEIELRSITKKGLRVVQQRISNLMGFEIIRQGETYCVIRNVAEAMETEFENILRRTFLILIDMADNCYDAISKGEFSRLDDIKLLEKTNNKFTDFLKRILNKHGYKEPEKLPFLYSIIRDLEQIADIYRYICDTFKSEKKFKFTKDVLGLFKEINTFLETFYHLFYKYDKVKAFEFHGEREKFKKRLYELFEKESGRNLLLLNYLDQLVNDIYHLFGPYLAIEFKNFQSVQ